MLQQTRVGAVLEHYRRFFERFPTVDALARSRTESVLAAWSGLGYYRRARNLHAAAKKVITGYKGEFPATSEQLRELPGIGRYTAAAIASIAFNEPVAVVDGNVKRVLQRVTGKPELKERETWALAEELISEKRPGDYNQAMMELGATVCLPGEPVCVACPVNTFCVTRGSHPRARKENRKSKSVAYALARQHGSVLLVQRPKSVSLMAGMWEFPEIPAPKDATALARFKHSILDTDFEVSVYSAAQSENGRWMKNAGLKRLALTGLARKILRHFELL